METALGVLFLLVLVWFVLKGLYVLLLVVWTEVGPAVRALGRAVAWLLWLPFAPFVALWFLIVGRPETEAERQQREEQEERGRQEAMSREQGDRQREEQLEAIRKALKID